MNPEIGAVIRLSEKVCGTGLEVGMIGTIVALLNDPSQAYEVEFCDENGVTIEEIPLLASQFTLIS